MASSTQHLRQTVEFEPNVPVEVALKFAGAGKIVSGRFGERVMFTLCDDRVMFLDLGPAQKVNELGPKPGEKFMLCKPGKKGAEWTCWLSPAAEQARAASEQAKESALERQLRESIELAQRGKVGEVGNGTFVVPGAGVSAPAPEPTAVSNGHFNTGLGSHHSKHPDLSVHQGWAQFLISETSALVDVYAAVLSYASGKYGNQVKPEDVRSLCVTAFIQGRSGKQSRDVA